MARDDGAEFDKTLIGPTHHGRWELHLIMILQWGYDFRIMHQRTRLCSTFYGFGGIAEGRMIPVGMNLPRA
jgi:hypothetical protein